MKRHEIAPIWPTATRVRLLRSDKAPPAVEVGLRIAIEGPGGATEDVDMLFVLDLDGAAGLALELEETLRAAVAEIVKLN